MSEILIIAYKRRLIFSEECMVIWEKIVPERRKSGDICLKAEEISKEKAVSIIKENGLVLVKVNKYGKIWDTPDESFREKYRGLPLPK